MKAFNLKLATWVMVASAATAVAQSEALDVSRDKVLPYDMAVESINKKLEVQKNGTFTANVLSSHGSSRVRIHISEVPGYESAKGWTIEIRDLSGQLVEEIKAGPRFFGLHGTWSGEIPTGGADVTLLTGEDPFSVVLDQYSYNILPFIPQAVTGKDDRQPITANVGFQKLGRPIAHLKIMHEGKQANCTGFLISGTLLITNAHCVRTEAEADSTVVEFGFDSVGAHTSLFRVANLEQFDEGLDFAILRLTKDAGQSFGFIKPTTSAVIIQAEQLVLIQHAEGGPKEFSQIDCRIDGVKRVGVGGEQTDFGHLCDTLGGSSGSPVFDLNSSGLVGLHHLGFLPSSPVAVNQAVPFGLVLESIKHKSPSIYSEIVGIAH